MGQHLENKISPAQSTVAEVFCATGEMGLTFCRICRGAGRAIIALAAAS
jgi:hypothetical protein